LDSMELAVAYSSWGAIGIIGTIAGGRILFGERLNAIGYVGVVLVIAAVGLLHKII
ncbi:SMR family transporter, partial [Helicobacter sp.]|uniref:SMR family transporter n=1 Tax=Helicobacter sp. TaxID=218 RepID=UPI0038909755